ncbi:MAG: STAS-like domain-containing protein [Elusimicrobiota bacterium]
MAQITLLISEICGDHVYTREDGKPLFDKIASALKSGDSVSVDFGGREIASESFLDEALVEHYIHPVIPEAQKLIALKGVAKPDQSLLKRIFDYRKRLDHKQRQQEIRANKRAAKAFAEPSQVQEP